MARRKGNYLTGVIGPVVTRVVNNKQIVSSKVPKGKIKHTPETKKSNQTFGMASALASQIRYTIGKQLSGMVDFDMCSRLSGAVFSILSRTRNKITREYHFDLDTFESLSGFNFNQSFRVSNRLKTMPEISWDENILQVGFPQIHQPGYLQFSYGSYKCTVTLTVSLFRLQEGLMVSEAVSREFIILKEVGVEKPLNYEFEVPAGCFYVLGIFMQYAALARNGFVAPNSPKLTAACICKAAIAEGEYRSRDNYRWEEMLKY
jgi:hypothetical protein